VLLDIVTFCAGCGEPFTPTRSNQARCCRRGRNRGVNKHKARTRRRGEHDLEFVGVDGEGVTHDGVHDYVLLTVGTESLHLDGRALETERIFEFLWRQFLDRPDATFVGFYLGYDFGQWLKGLPANRAEALLSNHGLARRRRTSRPHLPPFPVDWKGWQFDMLPMRRFKLRERGAESWLTICDVGPFFQSSFVSAIDPAAALEPICTAAEFATVKRGKEGRSSHKFSKAMIRYNVLECDLLARLMTQQNRGLVSEGIKLKRNQWIGPGQAAQQWLTNIKAPTGEAIREAVPQAFRDAAAAAYFGGWFEIFHHGPHAGRSWSYDINSAYPFIMSKLPCLLHGEFEELISIRRRTMTPLEIDSPGMVLVYAYVRGDHDLVGAALHRRPDGKVLRPLETEGWFWLAELQAAERAGFVEWIEISEGHRYTPCRHAPPLGDIADLYNGRLKVGKNTPAGRAKRLIYNSAYGKQAQSVGDPKFANAAYASLITAGCRTMILDAIAAHPRGAGDLLMVATDSVTFASPHPNLDLHQTRLGAWSESTHDNLSLFMPGVYWDDATRKNLSRARLKSRGINARVLAGRIDRIDRAWERYDRDGWPRLVLPVGFQMVSPRQALARGKWGLCGSVVTDGKRVISADPAHKRIGAGPGRSAPWRRCDDLASAPYEGRFGEEMSAAAADEFGDHPDGPIGGILLPQLLRG